MYGCPQFLATIPRTIPFQQALKEYGYTLARGDRRGFVALDHRCEVFAVPKWVGIKTKDVRTKLTDQAALPSVDEARLQIANTMKEVLDLADVRTLDHVVVAEQTCSFAEQGLLENAIKKRP